MVVGVVDVVGKGQQRVVVPVVVLQGDLADQVLLVDFLGLFIQGWRGQLFADLIAVGLNLAGL